MKRRLLAVEILSSEKSGKGQLKISSRADKSGGKWTGASDLDIWKAFKTGSRSALIHIYTLHFKELFLYALQFDSDRENVKDNIQDLFVYLYKHRKSLGKTDNIKFYLFKSLRRRIRISDDTRKLTLTDENNFTEIQQSIEENLIDEEHRLKSKILLNNAIQKLPLKQKEIIYYYYYQNFSYRQIADIMHFSQVKSARKLLYRALQSLREGINLKALFGLLLILLVLI